VKGVVSGVPLDIDNQYLRQNNPGAANARLLTRLENGGNELSLFNEYLPPYVKLGYIRYAVSLSVLLMFDEY
jgi:hypothetical protein